MASLHDLVETLGREEPRIHGLDLLQESPHFTQMNEEIQSGVRDCLACALACEQTIEHCLRRGGEYASQEHIRLVRDCIDLCRLSGELIVRGSTYSARLCMLCADACSACERWCSIFVGDAQMKACVTACRTCAASCRRIGPLH